jgi:voltage-dependent calcium channel alpha-2/delta-3
MIFRQFSSHHNRAIDELWYKRAVEQHMVHQESFVYSIPHDCGEHNDTLITASHAIFLRSKDKGERKAPVAVVGFQFLQSALYKRFMNITSYKV